MTASRRGKNVTCAYVSDLHGSRQRIESLSDILQRRIPDVLFVGGDILSVAHLTGSDASGAAIVGLDQFADLLSGLRDRLSDSYPQIFMILGNDDTKGPESTVQQGESDGLWIYVHNRKIEFRGYSIYGYSYVNPTPFLWKDWEKYDVSRYVDPRCISPEEGYRSEQLDPHEIRYSTISKDLDELSGRNDLSNSVFLFHAPPYQTMLDRAALDGQTIDHAPLDIHIGSIAIQRFIESRQPLLTLHGHVHESTRLTGSWRDKIGTTHMFNAAHDGPELAIIWFDLDDLEAAERELI
jgi:Icc-related predicted phosphoesterase